MTRPKKARKMCCTLKCNCFRPKGLKGVGSVRLLRDEIEALKLHDVDGLDQRTSAKRMKISQSTFARILSSARKKTASALVEGRVIDLG